MKSQKIEAKEWMQKNASEYDEALFLAIDATAEFNLWDTESCPGSHSVPNELLEAAEELVKWEKNSHNGLGESNQDNVLNEGFFQNETVHVSLKY